MPVWLHDGIVCLGEALKNATQPTFPKGVVLKDPKDWRKKQATRARGPVAMEETLDWLPEKFTRRIYAQKCEAVYEYVFASHWDDGHSVDNRAA